MESNESTLDIKGSSVDEETAADSEELDWDDTLASVAESDETAKFAPAEATASKANPAAEQPANEQPTSSNPAQAAGQEVMVAAPANTPVLTKKEQRRAKMLSELPPWLIANEPPENTRQWVSWRLYVANKGYLKPNQPVPDLWGPYLPRIQDNHQFVYDHSDKTMAIVANVSLKGGVGKTTITVWDGAEDSALTSGLTLAIDADSSGTKSASSYLGITDEATDWALPTSEAVHKILELGWVPTPEELTVFTAKHRASRLRIMAMDTSDIGREEMTRFIRILKRAVHSLHIDTTPGRKEQNTYGVLDAATLVVVNTLYNNTSTITAARQTLDTPEYGLRDRLNRVNEEGVPDPDDVILAVHGVELPYFNARYQSEIAEQFGLRPDQVSLFPVDEHVRYGRPVDRSLVSERYLFAVSEHRRRCAEAAIRWNKKHPLPSLPGDDPEADAAAAQAAEEAMQEIREAMDEIVAYRAKKLARKMARKTVRKAARKTAKKSAEKKQSQNSVSQPAADIERGTPVAPEMSEQ